MGQRCSSVLLAMLIVGLALTGARAGVASGYVAPGPGVATGPPEITAVRQPVVRPGGPVVLTGTNLQGATRVRAGGLTATFSYTDVLDTGMRVRVPAGYTSGDIVVTTPLGSAVAHIRLFRVDSVTPQTGFPGATQTITGQGFTALTDLWYYNPFSTSPADVESSIDYHVQSDTQMTITVPYTATNGADFYADIPGYSFPLGTFHMPTNTTCTCLHLASAQTGRRTLDARPNPTTNTIDTNNNPHLATWRYTFPTPSDQTHGLFQLTSPTTGQCLTAQDTTNLTHTDTPNLQQTTCSTDRGSDLYMRQIWYFVKATDSPANQTFELASAADGRCATATADQDNTPTTTAGCTDTTTQQWWVLDPDDVLLADAIPHGITLATDLATAKTTATITHRTTIYSAMTGHRALDAYDDPNSPWYPPTISHANTIGQWAIATQSDTDTQTGRFTLIDERHHRNRCLTETPQTYPNTPNNTNTAYPNLLMLPCIEIPTSSIENRQHWTLRQVNTTQYQIRNTNDNRCLTTSHGADLDNAIVDIEPCDPGLNPDQLWTFADTTGTDLAEPAATTFDRTVTFYSDSVSGYTLGTKPGNQVPIGMDPTAASDFQDVYTITSTPAERASGYFEVVNQKTGLCLTNYKDTDGLVLNLAVEDRCVTGDGEARFRQQWFFTSRDNGQFWLRSRQDGRCLAMSRFDWTTADTGLATCHVNTNPGPELWTLVDAWPADGGT